MLRTATSARAAPGDARPAVFYLPLDAGAVIPGYPALSPDGTLLVYPAGDAGSNRLYLRPLKDPAPAAIPKTEGATSAFFAASGEWVGFLADQSLKKVRLADGAEGVIAPYVEGLSGATWREDDTVLFATLPKGSLFEVPATGGAPTPLVIATHQFDRASSFPSTFPEGRPLLSTPSPLAACSVSST